jgi:hypothetical protein
MLKLQGHNGNSKAQYVAMENKPDNILIVSNLTIVSFLTPF